MTSRLDRLFMLLDNGSTSAIRKCAAENLGQVQKLYPHELSNLLTKLYPRIRSTSWETRIAAGQAIYYIASNIPQWQPKGGQETDDDSFPSPCQLIRNFNVQQLLDKKSSLLASEGRQFENSLMPGQDDKDRLLSQRRILNKQLGFDVLCNSESTSNSLITDSDLGCGPCDRDIPMEFENAAAEQNCQDRLAQKYSSKRKIKISSKQQDADFNHISESELVKKTKMENEGVTSNKSKCLNVTFELETEDWPFKTFCERLIDDLFGSSWEVRHGAATALRELMKCHSNGAGKSVTIPCNQMVIANEAWLSELVVHLLTVLTIDRFGDFVSDEVVAPVRETCAQTLSIVLKQLPRDCVLQVMTVLLQLLEQSQWEVRHSGFLALKYGLAVRQDLVDAILPLVMPAIVKGLIDSDDDVRAISAASLTSVSHQLLTVMPSEVPVVITHLLSILSDFDDITASTSSVLNLLSILLSHSEVSRTLRLLENLGNLIPRLYPFFYHISSFVRLSTLKAVKSIIPLHDEWSSSSVKLMFTHLFQRSLIENNCDILDYIEKVWDEILEACNISNVSMFILEQLGAWFSFAMQHALIPYDASIFVAAKPLNGEKIGDNNESAQAKYYIGGMDHITCYDTKHSDANVIRSRLFSSRLLGKLCGKLTSEADEETAVSISKLCLFHLSSKSSVQRMITSQVIYSWAQYQKPCRLEDNCQSHLLKCLDETLYYNEITTSFTRMQLECSNFLACLKESGVPPSEINFREILSIDEALNLTNEFYENVISYISKTKMDTMSSHCKQLRSLISEILTQNISHTLRVRTSLSGAVISLNIIPEKLNPVIRPLMDTLRKESNLQLQIQASENLSRLIECHSTNVSNPSSKVIKNLLSSLCSDTSRIPSLDLNSEGQINASEIYSDCVLTPRNGILTLSINAKKASQDGGKHNKPEGLSMLETISESKNNVVIEARGAELALEKMASYFGASLDSCIPSLWDCITEPLNKIKLLNSNYCKESCDNRCVQLMTGLHLIEVLTDSLHQTHLDQILDNLSSIKLCVTNCYTSVRHMAARSLAALAKIRTLEIMTYLIESLVPILDSLEPVHMHQGVIESIYYIVDKLSVAISPYVAMLVLPVMAAMSSSTCSVRVMSTQCFAQLVMLIPLEVGIESPVDMKASLKQHRLDERDFVEQLLDNTKLQDYKLPIDINAKLRHYQEEGINWLAFLNRYKLHGILCDDMGLGKTLMSICIIASDHHTHSRKYQGKDGLLISLVVCPPSLTDHWVSEVETFVSRDVLHPLHYAGTLNERFMMRSCVPRYNLVIASYDVVRNDLDFFKSIHWNYCVLDEGHIIKNGKTKVTRAVKTLVSNHRLILSGTPIQNNILDLWSLFDFLFPGFLGTERQFHMRYGQPILQSRDAKHESKAHEAGTLALESLHRQVLPFILRRLKENVLQDLPSKIIQDYYCDMSPLQLFLYQDFENSQVCQSVKDSLSNLDPLVAKKKNSHVFQALQYLRKLCNHPALVLTQSHPKYDDILSKFGNSVCDIQHAPKLIALKQLLMDCGIGCTNGTSSDCPINDSAVVNQHRVLLFCQLQAMLDIIENDLFKSCLPAVTYLKLDGRVAATDRYRIVKRFNEDPSIDVLLLTTHIGGLGLNLTGADTVIILEHDWNPMKDLQAMDRAHRIGQKKVVNVYRLITRGSLEEKIMSLQKFKLNIANTVISCDNSHLKTMATDQLIGLFSFKQSSSPEKVVSNKQMTLKSVIENLDELWSETHYEEEYDLDSFINSL